MSDNNQSRKRPRLISSFLFLDLLTDKRSRPILLYGLAIIVLGAVLYRWLEGWSWLDSFYFVVVSLTTIGYGDLVPTTSISKLITIFYALNGVAILLMLFDQIQRVRGGRVLSRATDGDNE